MSKKRLDEETMLSAYNKGVEQGISEGERQAMAIMAKYMFDAERYSIEEIEELTDLSYEEIIELREALPV